MEYSITELEQIAPDTFIAKAKPITGEIVSYQAGQFFGLKLPGDNPQARAHFFSVASSPTNKDYIEFCFKVYGNWTRSLSKKFIHDQLFLFGPYGKFIWENTITHAVFLAGGVGITPFMSILRFINDTNKKPSITLLYGNRTEEYITYRNEIENTLSALPNSKTIHILSDIEEKEVWHGYRGFITKEILEKEVDFSAKPTFFICGPPIFVQLAHKLLTKLSVPEETIKQELFSV